MIRIIADMNLSPTWVGAFRLAGIEARHWSEVGDPAATDASIMAWARENNYIVFTHDLDFSAILAATQAVSPSVLLLRMQNVLPDSAFALVLGALRGAETALLRGAVVTVGAAGARVRVLPLGNN